MQGCRKKFELTGASTIIEYWSMGDVWDYFPKSTDTFITHNTLSNNLPK